MRCVGAAFGIVFHGFDLLLLFITSSLYQLAGSKLISNADEPLSLSLIVTVLACK
jgi:hypothetical protein